MAKNDYRRSLIMLRGMEKGYSGHARLETRVLTGTISFTVTAPAGNEPLCAALIGRRGNGISGVNLGALREDGRGQKGLLATFDPRNIAGMDLSAIAACVIARGGEPVLYGWVNGSTTLDWQRVRDFLPTICGAPREAPQPQERAEPVPPAEEETAEAALPTEEETTEESAEPEENPISFFADTPEEDLAEAEESSDEAPSLTPAGEALGLDMSREWPKEAEDLRVLFRTHPRFEPFEMPDFVFVRAAMAEETHIDSCAVGIRAENGAVTGVCYAIPMPYSLKPPAGLEEAVWIGDNNRGWWVTVRDIPGE